VFASTVALVGSGSIAGGAAVNAKPSAGITAAHAATAAFLAAVALGNAAVALSNAAVALSNAAVALGNADVAILRFLHSRPHFPPWLFKGQYNEFFYFRFFTSGLHLSLFLGIRKLSNLASTLTFIFS
jgi:hypothetical protein